jgi:glycosyltransferase involved in cell wall biosynthesis
MPIRKSVYHFFLDSRISGPHIYVKTLEAKFCNRFDFIYITSGRGPNTDISLLNIRHFFFPLYLIEVPLNVILILLYCAVGKIRLTNSIFHIHASENIAPVIASFFLRKRVIWHLHSLWSRYDFYYQFSRLLLSTLPHTAIVVTKAIAERYQIPKYYVLGSPIDTHFWSGASNVSVISAHSEEKTIVCVANINWLKGQNFLLEAISSMDFPLKVFIIGQFLRTHQPFEASLRSRSSEIMQTHPTTSIFITGLMTSENIRSKLQSSDLFILPSLSEACPLALLEAMATERICLASSVGGIPEIIKHGSNGFLFPSGDISALRELILVCIALSAKQKREIGANARQTVLTHHSVETISSKLESIYC